MWQNPAKSLVQIFFNILLCCALVPVKSVGTVIVALIWPEALVYLATKFPILSFCSAVIMLGFCCGFVLSGIRPQCRRAEAFIAGLIILVAFFAASEDYFDIAHPFAVLSGVLAIFGICHGLKSGQKSKLMRRIRLTVHFCINLFFMLGKLPALKWIRNLCLRMYL